MPKSIKVTSIGAGNFASHIIPGLYKVGCDIRQVFSRRMDNALSLGLKVKAQAVNDLSLIDDSADIYLIMSADDAIGDILDLIGADLSDKIIAHSSGSMGTKILSKKTKKYGSFYALQSFRKGSELDLSQVPFMVNGADKDTLNTLRILARQLSPQVLVATDEERLYYHLAAVYINNFTNHLACISNTLLKEQGLDYDVLLPIIEKTSEKLKSISPCDNQTGPAIRHDNRVILKHLALLDNNETWKEVYQSLSKSIQKTYENDQ